MKSYLYIRHAFCFKYIDKSKQKMMLIENNLIFKCDESN